MLRNVGKCVMVLILGLCCAMAFSPRAIADQKPTVKTLATTKEKTKESGTLPVRVWKETRSYQRLERAILAGVKLDESQQSAVKKAFASLYRLMKDNPKTARRYGSVYSAYRADKIKERKVDLKKAKKARNKKLVKEIEADIAKHTPGTEANMTPTLSEILTGDLAPLMKADQIADYQYILDRWKTLKRQSPAEGPIRMLIRAIQDPDLKLDTEQRQAVNGVLIETQLEMRKNRDPDNIAKLAASARVDVLKSLKSEQQAHLDKVLHMFAAEFKKLRKYAKAWHGKRGRAAPAHYNQPIPWEE